MHTEHILSLISLHNQLNHFLKNLAIVGGLLMFATFGPGSASADKR